MNIRQVMCATKFLPKSMLAPNAWVGHIPFARWLIQEIKPKLFVELGTHSGNSYFAFCQAILEEGIDTKCFAVDTWQGDEHAGQYSEEIFKYVNSHNENNYKRFSQLLRMTFDNATDKFSDGTIDLLHIDGLHTYEAVRHDFDAWLSKLAPGAIVLFHDTNVRIKDFGVWKLWEELEAMYPRNLNFSHSHGLGVIQLNNPPPEKEIAWLTASSQDKSTLLEYFSALGTKQLDAFRVIELEGYTRHLEGAISECQIELKQKEQLTSQLSNMTDRNAELQQVLSQKNTELAALHNSLSWRVTRPLRFISKQLKTTHE